MTRILFLGDLAATGFGTVTYDLGRALLGLGHDVRFVSQNDLTTLEEPFASRTFIVNPDIVDAERADQLGMNSLALLREGVIGLLNGALWSDGWTAEAAFLLGDYWGASHFVLADPARTAAFRSVPTVHYVPIEGVDLPPSWKRLWDVVHPVAMSEFGADQLKLVTGTRPPVVYHGVDTAQFRPISPERPLYLDGTKLRTRAECKRFFGLDPKAKLVFRADRHMPRKRYASLLRAMAPVMARRPDVALLIHCNPDDQGGHLRDQISKLHPAIARRVAVTNGARVTRDQLTALYNAADVYASPSAEGFGLTIAESMACFPAETRVHARGVRAGMRRSYTGPLIRVTTDGGIVEATPEHPFWANNRWQSAGTLSVGSRLLYTALDGAPDVLTGRIRDVADHAAHAYGSRNRRSFGAQLWIDPMGEAHAGTSSIVRGHQPSASGLALSTGVGVLGRPDRWGGHGHHTEDGGPQMAAVLRDRKYISRLAPMAPSAFAGASLHLSEGGHESRSAVVSVRSRRAVALADLQGASPVAGHQGPTDGPRDPMVRPKAEARLDGPVERRAVESHLADPRSEYATITAIEYVEVRDLPVYNLTTDSGTYLAGGFLVHNCGVPAVGMNYSSVAEVIGPGGLLAPVNHLVDNEYDHAWAAVDEKVFGDQVAKLLDDPALRRSFGRAAREHIVSSFSWARAAVQFSSIIGERIGMEAVAA